MLQTEVLSIVVITIFISALVIYLGNRIKRLQTDEVPRGFVLTGVLFVEAILDMTVKTMGKKHGPKMAAYIGSVFLYLLLANTVGLFGLSAPTANYSVTLVLALITWIMIQYTKIRENGFKGFIKGFFEPFAPFVIPNIFGTLAPLISLSLRLFGNVLSGSIIMSLLYTFTGWLSGQIPLLGASGVNFLSVFVTPWVHLYFDLFSGFLQAFLFISLTSVFIAVEYNEE